MRGYFGIGVEGISKPINLGNLMRSANAFGAAFFFTIDAAALAPRSIADTSRGSRQVPYYALPDVAALILPRGCRLVGVEVVDEAVDLPSFHHPDCAAYVLGRERGALSAELQARCDHLIRIPTQFCINLATAGAIVMYDRLRMLGRFPERPVGVDAALQPLEPHRHGEPLKRKVDA